MTRLLFDPSEMRGALVVTAAQLHKNGSPSTWWHHFREEANASGRRSVLKGAQLSSGSPLLASLDLRGCVLWKCELKDIFLADEMRGDMETVFYESNLRRCAISLNPPAVGLHPLNLYGSCLVSCDFHGAYIQLHLRRSSISECDLSGATFPDLLIEDSELSRVLLERASWRGFLIARSSLTHCGFSQATLCGSSSDQPGCFIDTEMKNRTHLHQACLTDVEWRGGRLESFYATAGVWDKVRLSDLEINRAEFHRTDFRHVDSVNVSMRGVSIDAETKFFDSPRWQEALEVAANLKIPSAAVDRVSF